MSDLNEDTTPDPAKVAKAIEEHGCGCHFHKGTTWTCALHADGTCWRDTDGDGNCGARGCPWCAPGVALDKRVIPPERRLFGTAGAEILYDDLASAYESCIDGHYEIEELTGGSSVTLVEHTVRPQIDHMPSTETIAEWLVEHVSENALVDEGFYEDMVEVGATEEVVAAIDALREAWAKKIRWAMADQEVAQHKITLVPQRGLTPDDKDDWEPIANGTEYLYSAGKGNPTCLGCGHRKRQHFTVEMGGSTRGVECRFNECGCGTPEYEPEPEVRDENSRCEHGRPFGLCVYPQCAPDEED